MKDTTGLVQVAIILKDIEEGKMTAIDALLPLMRVVDVMIENNTKKNEVE